ncbi:MAG: GNAT family protein [Clostridiales bacterium]
MIIETKRLLLIPLNIKQLELYLNNRDMFIKNIGYYINDRKMSKHIVKAYKQKIEFMKLYDNLDLIITCWQVVLKKYKIITSEITINGTPSDNEIELSYKTDEEYQNKGYMTEALNAYMYWIFYQNKYKIKSVFAMVSKNNLPSKKVLKKIGFNVKFSKYEVDLFEFRNPKK